MGDSPPQGGNGRKFRNKLKKGVGVLIHRTCVPNLIKIGQYLGEKKSGENLGGDSLPRGETGGNFEKMKKKPSGYSYIEHVYQIS